MSTAAKKRSSCGLAKKKERKKMKWLRKVKIANERKTFQEEKIKKEIGKKLDSYFDQHIKSTGSSSFLRPCTQNPDTESASQAPLVILLGRELYLYNFRSYPGSWKEKENVKNCIRIE